MSRTALLSMDLQVNHIAHVPDGCLPDAVRALETARAAEVPVIHVALRLRPGHVDCHADNKIFGALPLHLFGPTGGLLAGVAGVRAGARLRSKRRARNACWSRGAGRGLRPRSSPSRTAA
ncbi:hypothetical protein OG458_39350 [Streptomyces sp. NBC_01281]|uniref:hypothetical protein n=1 Tax=Streptomyces sp. NBC_01281 TaxID=2903811 RepID=UPI002E11BDA2|nr:hypothetical protein OG458_39350 [Streptomyces sp. NBC_01281]